MTPEELVAHVKVMVGRYPFATIQDEEDVVQECCIEALAAVDRFDPIYGVAITTFINRRIWGRIIDCYRERTGWRLTHKPPVTEPLSGATNVSASSEIDAEDYVEICSNLIRTMTAKKRDADILVAYFVHHESAVSLAERYRFSEMMVYWIVRPFRDRMPEIVRRALELRPVPG